MHKSYWKKANANRMSVLIDGATYFWRFAQVAMKATKEIFILAWDIDSRIFLWTGEQTGVAPVDLANFLKSLLDRNPELEIRILYWNPAIVYKLERESVSEKKQRFSHPRLHFEVDDLHPTASSQHAKIVIVDNSLAFAGGLDLSRDRWDTSEHLAGDKRRINPLGEPYRPFHDAQLVLDGLAVQMLSDYAKKRWELITGEKIKETRVESDLWPENLPEDFKNVEVMLSRTQAKFENFSEVRENERLFCEMLLSATDKIYIETEYLTADKIVQSLESQLKKKRGPDIVIVCPLQCTGWFEEVSMGILRDRCLKRLEKADLYHRLRVYYPTIPGLEDNFITVHSKIVIVDDDWFALGSTNLSNRSLGVDFECTLSVKANRRRDVRQSIATIRNKLLAEHLGASLESVQNYSKETPSIIQLTEKFKSPGRSLAPLPALDNYPIVEEVIPNTIDPKHPIRAVELLEGKSSHSLLKRIGKTLLRLTPILVLLCLGLLWQLPFVQERLSDEELAKWWHPLKQSAFLPLYVMTTFVVGGLVFFPLLVLIMMTVLLFDPLPAFLLSLGGTLSSGTVTYVIGRHWGNKILSIFNEEKINAVREKLKDQGIITITALRLIPVIPFSVFNLFCGSLHIKLKPFLIGTLLGILPGISLLTIVKGMSFNIFEGIQDKPFMMLALLAGTMTLASLTLSAAVGLFRRRTRRHREISSVH